MFNNVGPIYFCGPTIGSTKSNPYLPFVILVHNKNCSILFTKIPNPCLLLPTLLIIGEMTILSIPIFISLSTSSYLEEEPLFTDVVLLGFFFYSNKWLQNPQTNFKSIQTNIHDEIYKNHYQIYLFLCPISPFLCTSMCFLL